MAGRLAGLGYEVVRLDDAVPTVGEALDRAVAAGATGALVVVVEPVRRWAVARVVAERRSAPLAASPDLAGGGSREIESAVFEGMLLVPAAAMFETRSRLRLWSRHLAGLPGSRLEPGSPLLAWAWTRAPGAAPDAEAELREAASRATAFFADLPPGAAAEVPAPPLERWRRLAEADRFREENHLFLGAGYTRAEEAVPVSVAAAPGRPAEALPAAAVDPGGASGPSLWIGVLHGPVLVSVGMAGYSGGRRFAETFFRQGADGVWYATALTAWATQRLEVTVSGQAAFVPRNWVLLAAGLELRGTHLSVSADPANLVAAERWLAGVGATAQAAVMWRSLHLGPAASAGILVEGGKAAPYLRWTVQAGWRF